MGGKSSKATKPSAVVSRPVFDLPDPNIANKQTNVSPSTAGYNNNKPLKNIDKFAALLLDPTQSIDDLAKAFEELRVDQPDPSSSSSPSSILDDWTIEGETLLTHVLKNGKDIDSIRILNFLYQLDHGLLFMASRSPKTETPYASPLMTALQHNAQPLALEWLYDYDLTPLETTYGKTTILSTLLNAHIFDPQRLQRLLTHTMLHIDKFKEYKSAANAIMYSPDVLEMEQELFLLKSQLDRYRASAKAASDSSDNSTQGPQSHNGPPGGYLWNKKSPLLYIKDPEEIKLGQQYEKLLALLSTKKNQETDAHYQGVPDYAKPTKLNSIREQGRVLLRSMQYESIKEYVRKSNNQHIAQSGAPPQVYSVLGRFGAIFNEDSEKDESWHELTPIEPGHAVNRNANVHGQSAYAKSFAFLPNILGIASHYSNQASSIAKICSMGQCVPQSAVVSLRYTGLINNYQRIGSLYNNYSYFSIVEALLDHPNPFISKYFSPITFHSRYPAPNLPLTNPIESSGHLAVYQAGVVKAREQLKLEREGRSEMAEPYLSTYILASMGLTFDIFVKDDSFLNGLPYIIDYTTWWTLSRFGTWPNQLLKRMNELYDHQLSNLPNDHAELSQVGPPSLYGLPLASVAETESHPLNQFDQEDGDDDNADRQVEKSDHDDNSDDPDDNDDDDDDNGNQAPSFQKVANRARILLQSIKSGTDRENSSILDSVKNGETPGTISYSLPQGQSGDLLYQKQYLPPIDRLSLETFKLSGLGEQYQIPYQMHQLLVANQNFPGHRLTTQQTRHSLHYMIKDFSGALSDVGSQRAENLLMLHFSQPKIPFVQTFLACQDQIPFTKTHTKSFMDYLYKQHPQMLILEEFGELVANGNLHNSADPRLTEALEALSLRFEPFDPNQNHATTNPNNLLTLSQIDQLSILTSGVIFAEPSEIFQANPNRSTSFYLGDHFPAYSREYRYVDCVLSAYDQIKAQIDAYQEGLSQQQKQEGEPKTNNGPHDQENLVETATAPVTNLNSEPLDLIIQLPAPAQTAKFPTAVGNVVRQRSHPYYASYLTSGEVVHSTPLENKHLFAQTLHLSQNTNLSILTKSSNDLSHRWTVNQYDSVDINERYNRYPKVLYRIPTYHNLKSDINSTRPYLFDSFGIITNFQDAMPPGILWYLLMYAPVDNDDDLFEVLRRCRVDIVNRYQQTTLMYAAIRQCSTKILQTILTLIPNPNQQDGYLRTFMHYLSMTGYWHTLTYNKWEHGNVHNHSSNVFDFLWKLFYDHGCLIDILDISQHTPLSYAITTDSPGDIVKLLFDFTISMTPKQQENYSILFLRRIISDIDTQYTNGYVIDPSDGTANNLIKLFNQNNSDGYLIPNILPTRFTTTLDYKNDNNDNNNLPPHLTDTNIATGLDDTIFSQQGCCPRKPLVIDDFGTGAVSSKESRLEHYPDSVESVVQYRYPMTPVPDWANLCSILGFSTVLTPQQHLQRQYSAATHELHRHAALLRIRDQVRYLKQASIPVTTPFKPHVDDENTSDEWNQPETKDVLAKTISPFSKMPTKAECEGYWPELPPKPIVDLASLPPNMQDVYSNPIFPLKPSDVADSVPTENTSPKLELPPSIYIAASLYLSSTTTDLDGKGDDNKNDPNQALSPQPPTIPSLPAPQQSLLGFQRGNNFTNVHFLLRRFYHNDYELRGPFNSKVQSTIVSAGTNNIHFQAQNISISDRFDVRDSYLLLQRTDNNDKVVSQPNMSIFDLMVQQTYFKAVHLQGGYAYLPTYEQNELSPIYISPFREGFNTAKNSTPFQNMIEKYRLENGAEYLYPPDVWVHFFATILLSFRLFIFFEQLKQLSSIGNKDVCKVYDNNHDDDDSDDNNKNLAKLLNKKGQSTTPPDSTSRLTYSLDQYLSTMVYSPGRLEQHDLIKKQIDELKRPSLPTVNISNTQIEFRPPQTNPKPHTYNQLFTPILQEGYWKRIVLDLSSLGSVDQLYPGLKGAKSSIEENETSIWTELVNKYCLDSTFNRLVVPSEKIRLLSIDSRVVKKFLSPGGELVGGSFTSEGVTSLGAYLYYTFALAALPLATQWFGEYLETFCTFRRKRV